MGKICSCLTSLKAMQKYPIIIEFITTGKSNLSSNKGSVHILRMVFLFPLQGGIFQYFLFSLLGGIFPNTFYFLSKEGFYKESIHYKIQNFPIFVINGQSPKEKPGNWKIIGSKTEKTRKNSNTQVKVNNKETFYPPVEGEKKNYQDIFLREFSYNLFTIRKLFSLLLSQTHDCWDVKIENEKSFHSRKENKK